MREHVLLNNGSHIKLWWLAHHYICLVLTGIMLSCPEEPFREIRNIILKFMFILSCSQLVQYQYQMRRLYILRSLKKADPLETTSEIASEIMSISLSANLGIVSFVLIFFQVVQMYVSYSIYILHRSYMWKYSQPLIGAFLIAMMAVGNTTTILYTCYNKIERKSKCS